MQVQQQYSSSNTQHPYNPNMFATPSQQPQYTLQSEQPKDSEEMFLALERLLMGISPFPPTIPTLAKPTCPSLDDQIMAEIATSSPSIPSIVLNEQSLDMLQQYYQNQDSATSQNFQLDNWNADQSDCSSTSRSASPPASPYSYTSSMTSSPSMPVASDLWMVAQQPQPQDWNMSLFDPMSLPLTVPGFENYMTQSSTVNNNNLYSESLLTCQQSSLIQATKSSNKKVVKSHRRSSSSCSAISAYESNVRREYRASSISSVGSAGSNSNTRPVKSYACSTCTKAFPTRTQLKSHMAIHTDSFPFPCMHPGCELHFKRKHDLRRHVDAKHALVKKYLCTGGCGEGFGRRDQMVRHLRRGKCGVSQGFQTD